MSATAASGRAIPSSGQAVSDRPRNRLAGLAVTRNKAGVLLDWLVAFWVFTGAFVLVEPSPYEVSFLLVLPVALFAGIGLHRSTLGLLAIFVGFTPFALIGAFQSRFTPTMDALIFVIVTIFLFLTSYVAANYVADAPAKRMKIIIRAYAAAAVISAAVGTGAYLGVIPGADVFTLYGRARAFFNDPNVFGPFLILPAMFALQRLMLGPKRKLLLPAAIVMAVFVGVFASFSRAAWGHLAISAVLCFVLCFALEANARAKVRMMILALGGVMVLMIGLIGLLSIPAVERLFETRTASQEYDTGETGRFGRQGYAFDLALQHPWGIGPLEFRNYRVREEPHNTYVNVLHVYGWGGGLIYYVMVALTLWRGGVGLSRAGPHRLLLIPLMATYVPLASEAAIIDIDHWRHYFLIVGLIWGVTAEYRPYAKGEKAKLESLV